MTEPLRYGVIGTGMMGREHIANIAALDDADVVAVADTDAESRRAALAMPGMNGVAAFEDHQQLLDDHEVDAVVVATPNMTHADVVLDVLDAGINVLIEKPLCTTVEDCYRIEEAARRSDGLAWVGLEYRYMPPIARLIDEVESGAVGSVKMIALREHRFPFLPKVDDWNRFNENSGGTLVEKCCHFFDLMNLISGAAPIRVFASGAQDVNHLDEVYDGRVPDVLDNAFVIVDYDNGTRALLDLSMFAEVARYQEEVVVTGDRGRVAAYVPGPLGEQEGLHGFVEVGDRIHHRFSVEEVKNSEVRYEGLHHGSSYLEHVDFQKAVRGAITASKQRETTDFIAAVRGGVEPAVTVRDGLLSVAIGVAAQRSIAERRIVEMAEVLED